jgi:hypothetical protein
MNSWHYSPSKLYPVAWNVSRILGWFFNRYRNRSRGSGMDSGCANHLNTDSHTTGEMMTQHESLGNFSNDDVDLYLDCLAGCEALCSLYEQLSHARSGGSEGEAAVGQEVAAQLLPQYVEGIENVAKKLSELKQSQVPPTYRVRCIKFLPKEVAAEVSDKIEELAPTT